LGIAVGNRRATKKPSEGLGFFRLDNDDDEGLPGAEVGFRSARARGHACRHAGGGQDHGVGGHGLHRGAILARGMTRRNMNRLTPDRCRTAVTLALQ
jgi:hypothetical protein